jgi:ketosteroid isomerase-like protein
MKKIMAKDAVYNQAEGLPYGGTYIGFDQLVTMFQKAQGYFDLTIEKAPVYYTNPATNGVFIYFWIHVKSKKSGKEISMPISEYYEVKDGLITHIRPYYFDTKTFSAFLE